ncbi:gametogenetin-binding protein 1-like isoform X2 [Sturnira hondurensis]|uniref:gametogenetin-binding protein 1-like isoform X2 n=1 Tax=Sturnira hondurensis TaxID=192404 RepID=UPI00187919B0|nr:gametogenetin-binding protein 1-like isoform X2 [Sturnira hondurensis]
MLHFFRSLVGSKGSPKSSDKALLGDQQCPLRELAAASLVTAGQRGVGKKDPKLQASVPHTLTMALPQHSPSGLGMGVGVLGITAPGVEVKSVQPRESLEVLGNLSEKEREEEEEEEAAEEPSGDTGTSDRAHFPQALEVKQRATGPLEVSPEVSTREEKKEWLLDGDLRLASLNVGATPWNHLLTLYKQLQKLAMAKFPIKEGSPHRRKVRKRKWRKRTAHSSSVFQALSPSSRHCRRHLGQLIQWGHQADGEGSHHPACGECWGPGREALRQLKHHPRLERRVQSPPGVVYSPEHLLLEEMDEMGNWPPE